LAFTAFSTTSLKSFFRPNPLSSIPPADCRSAANLLTRHEARRIALNIAKLLAAEAFGLFFKQWKIRAHLDDAPNRRVTVCRSIQREE
jgi:hypothetical protein